MKYLNNIFKNPVVRIRLTMFNKKVNFLFVSAKQRNISALKKVGVKSRISTKIPPRY